MTRTERRDEIKRVYPLAERGDAAAVSQLHRVLKAIRVVRSCEVCGEKCRGKRCISHRKHLASMKRTLAIA
jgi:hypothetical protein